MAARRRAYAGPGRTCPVRRTADELAPALGMAPRAASSLVSLVRRCEELPAAMDALADGRMDLPQLRCLDAHARHLPPGPRRALEAAAVRWAPRRTRQQLDAALAAEAVRLDPAHATEMVEHGVSERDVQVRPSPLAGCRRLVADLPTDQAHAAWLALNGAARTARRGAKERGDERTLAAAARRPAHRRPDRAERGRRRRRRHGRADGGADPGGAVPARRGPGRGRRRHPHRRA